jgi:hypothetical protein
MRRPVPSPEYPARKRARRLFLASCVLGTAHFVTAGCATESPRSAEVDPLVGGPPIPAAPAARPSTAPPASLAGPAPLPAPSSSTSPAALAPGAFTPLDPNHDLRIANGGAAAANPPAGDGWHGPSAPADVTLHRPELAGDAPPAPRSPPQPAPGFALTAASAVGTYEDAQRLLRAHGVTWQRLETAGDAGEWKFTCWVPNRQDPNIHQTYGYQAPDPVSAMRAVLEQIEREQH